MRRPNRTSWMKGPAAYTVDRRVRVLTRWAFPALTPRFHSGWCRHISQRKALIGSTRDARGAGR
jgi:hypothetical protein